MKSTIMTGDIVVVSNIELDTNMKAKQWPIHTIIGQYRPDSKAFLMTNLDKIHVVTLPTQIMPDGSILTDPIVNIIPMDRIKVRIGKNSSLRTNFNETIEKITVSVEEIEREAMQDIVPLEDGDLINSLMTKILTDVKFANQFEHVAFRTMDKDTALYVHKVLCSYSHREIEEIFGLTLGENLNLRKRIKIMAGLNNK